MTKLDIHKLYIWADLLIFDESVLAYVSEFDADFPSKVNKRK